MGNEVDNKFSWVIKNFKSLKSTVLYSDDFSIGGCKWQLQTYPKGCIAGYFSLYLKLYKNGSLPRGWKRHANISVTVVNWISEKLSKRYETQIWFDEKTTLTKMIAQSKLNKIDNGFLLNGEPKILVQIDVLDQVICELRESEEPLQPMEEVKQEIDGELSTDLLNKTQQFQEGFEFYGFLLFPSQVESVKLIFESHPNIASEVRTKSQYLRKTYINVILGLIETLCQSPKELTDDDLKEASAALSYVVDAGFKVDWLEKKLNQVLVKKKTVKSGETCLLEMEEELLKLNKKWSDHKALLEKKKAEVAAAEMPFSFDNFL